MTNRTCKKCGIEKEITDFYTIATKSKQPKTLWKCKDCIKQDRKDRYYRIKERENSQCSAYKKAHAGDIKDYNKSYYDIHKNEIKGQKVSYFEKHPDKRLLKKIYKRNQYYGCDVSNYDEIVSKLLIQQDNLCAICGSEFSETNKPCLDHNHKTHQLRGLLCRRCNLSIGNLLDSVTVCENAAMYLYSYQVSK